MDEAKVGEILRPGDAHENRQREARVRESFWRTARRAARHIPFMDEVVAAYTRWFTLGVWRHLDGWVLITGTKR